MSTNKTSGLPCEARKVRPEQLNPNPFHYFCSGHLVKYLRYPALRSPPKQNDPSPRFFVHKHYIHPPILLKSRANLDPQSHHNYFTTTAPSLTPPSSYPPPPPTPPPSPTSPSTPPKPRPSQPTSPPTKPSTPLPPGADSQSQTAARGPTSASERRCRGRRGIGGMWAGIGK